MSSRRRRPPGRRRRHPLLALTPFLPLLASPSAAATTDTVASGAGGVAVPLSAAFYADTSCLLSIDRRPSVGRTQLGADVANESSRTLIHCDTEDGRRLTLAARGDTLEPGIRVPLLDAAALAAGSDGLAAWLTLAEEDNLAPDPAVETAEGTDGDPPLPRGLVRGHVVVRELPSAEPTNERRGDQRVFARIDGLLVPPFVGGFDPRGQDEADDGTADPEGGEIEQTGGDGRDLPE